MQPVAAIVDWQHLGRMLGVAQRLVEIDDAVQDAAFADQWLNVTRCSSRTGFQAPGRNVSLPNGVRWRRTI